jgi:general secretion pathway protein D
MKMKTVKSMHNLLILSALLIACVRPPHGRAQTPVDQTDPGVLIETLNVKRLTMHQFARLLSMGSGWKIVASKEASDIEISVYLEDVYTESALKAVCQAYNLWYKRDSVNGIVSVITLDEYQKGMRIHTDEAVEVVTLQYPDARLIADSLQRLFSNRIVWHRQDYRQRQLNDPIEDVELALERMDALADRAQFSTEGTSGERGTRSSRYRRDSYGSRYGSSQYGGSRYGDSRYSGGRSTFGYGMQENQIVEDVERDIPDELLLERLTQGQPTTGRIDQPGVVYISTFRETNKLLLRSSDPESLQEIVAVIKKMDKPRPQILLEVKVLEITLDDEDARGVDWLFQTGDVSGGRSVGINTTGLGSSYGRILPPSAGLIPQGTGLDPRASVLQVVTNNVLARIQWLEDRNRITRLATPTLCVADNEASRVFIGTRTTVLKSVNVRQDTTSGDNPITIESVDPQTDRENIGTTLLITPRIHADRTATIRIVQEESVLGNVQTIQYGNQESFQSQDVESRSVVTTVLASDGKISAIGGLIRETTGKREVSVPGLKDVPLIGPLFKTRLENRERRELLILIRPFVLLAPGESESVTDDLLQRLSKHPSARDDIPSLRIGQDDAILFHEKLYDIPSDAYKDASKRAPIWTTE